jgi:tetratricopeptide (TPR) repeat protein
MFMPAQHRHSHPLQRCLAGRVVAAAALVLLAGAMMAAVAADDPRLGQRDAAQQTFLRLMDEARYDEAIVIGGQILELSAAVFGTDSLELAQPLTNLGLAELRRNGLPAAENRFATAIALIERLEGVGSPRLVNPLIGLAETQHRLRQYALANLTYQRALTLSHAAEGFYNRMQLTILDGLAESYLGMDQLGRANRQQEVQLEIAQRNAREAKDDASELQLFEAAMKLGRWYNRTGQYPEARGQFVYARRLNQDSATPDVNRGTDAILGEAMSYENEGALPAASAVLRRALERIEAEPERDPQLRAKVLVARGDLNIVARQPSSASRDYAEAWRELSADPALAGVRDGYFAQPLRIAGPELPRLVDEEGRRIEVRTRTGGGFQPGRVLAGMTVGADGRPRDLRVLESEPPGLLDKQLRRTLEFSYFRPRLADGAPVDTPDQQFAHDFSYPRATPKTERPADAPAAGDTNTPLPNPTQP